MKFSLNTYLYIYICIYIYTYSIKTGGGGRFDLGHQSEIYSPNLSLEEIQRLPVPLYVWLPYTGFASTEHTTYNYYSICIHDIIYRSTAVEKSTKKAGYTWRKCSQMFLDSSALFFFHSKEMSIRMRLLTL